MLEDLFTISQEALGKRDLANILADVAKAITKTSPFKRAIISLYDPPLDLSNPKESVVYGFSFSGLSQAEKEKLEKMESDEIPVNLDKFDQKFKLSNSYYIPHSEKPNSMRKEKGEIKSRVPIEEMQEWHPDDSLYIPMYQKEKIIGHISMDDPADGRAPTVDTLKPIETFANLAAMAVTRVRQMEKLQQQKESIKALHSLGFELAAIEDLGLLLKKILQILKKDFHYDYGAVLLKEGDYLVLKAQECKIEKNLTYKPGKKLKVGKEGISGWVAANKKPAKVGDVGDDRRYIPGFPGIKSELAVPIQAGDKFFGVLDIESQKLDAFDQDDVELLGSVASQLAVAISNLTGKEKLRELAIRDDLTGIFNRRYFFETLEGELERAKRYGRKLSLILLDIDDLKTVNDTHGHQVGDQLLEELGQILGKNLRGSDQIYRYGGDEFTVILPETSIQAGRRAAERLIKGIESFVFRKGTRITASGGLSTFPEDGENEDALIKVADERAYLAKKAGGNCIISQGNL